MKKTKIYILYIVIFLFFGCVDNNNPFISNDIEYSAFDIGEVRDLFISDSTLFVGTESEGIYIYNINHQNSLDLLYQNIDWGYRKDIRSVHFDKNSQIVFALDRFGSIYHGFYPFLIDSSESYLGDADTLVAINGGQCNVSFKNATKFFIKENLLDPEIFILYKRNSNNELYLEESFSALRRISYTEYFNNPAFEFELFGDAFVECSDDLIDIDDSLSYDVNDFHYDNNKFYLGDNSKIDIFSYQNSLDNSIQLGTKVRTVFSSNNYVLGGTDNGCYITLPPNNGNDSDNNNILHIADGYTIYDIFYDSNLSKLILSAGNKGVLIYSWDGQSLNAEFDFRLLSSYAFTARIYKNLVLVASKNGLEIFNIEE